MPMKPRLPFALATSLALAGCSSGSSSSASSLPSNSTLCRLHIGRSSATDAVALLGAPTIREGLPDGSLSLEYQYPASPTPIDLHLDFNTHQVFTGAITLNTAEPPCWLAEAGAPDGAP